MQSEKGVASVLEAQLQNTQAKIRRQGEQIGLLNHVLQSSCALIDDEIARLTELRDVLANAIVGEG